MRRKNGKVTRATVLMALPADIIFKMRGCFQRSFLDFRIRSHQRFANYAQYVDYSNLSTDARKEAIERLQATWKHMNKLRNWD